ncbi:MAG TPA: alpha/beta family hydrolase [Phnomibacter sp.]|nr:alpha/beta family hydrolase [Phnomibacter sp.]
MHPHEIHLRVGSIQLNGAYCPLPDMHGMIVFAHGSGSSHRSPRNQMVASWLQREGFGTLLFDLLTPEEDTFYENRFNIDLLTQRLIGATRWLHHQTEAHEVPVGYFGASTGAAAAICAAAQTPGIAAVVSRGGRPDLARQALRQLDSPTLLIVGSLDEEVLQLNQMAFDSMHCEKQMAIVEGATHLFEETGKMQEVCRLAAGWLHAHLDHVNAT